MNKFKITLGVLLLSTVISFSSFGSGTPIANHPTSMSNIQSELIQSLDRAELDKNGIYKASAKVTFNIDGENKIHVLNVASEEAYLIDFVKNHLQGVKTSSKLEKEKVYRINISFECV